MAKNRKIAAAELIVVIKFINSISYLFNFTLNKKILKFNTYFKKFRDFLFRANEYRRLDTIRNYNSRIYCTGNNYFQYTHVVVVDHCAYSFGSCYCFVHHQPIHQTLKINTYLCGT